MIEKWSHCLDNSGAIAAVLMDLSKAYDCIPHDLLIAKLYAYGLDTSALNLNIVTCPTGNKGLKLTIALVIGLMSLLGFHRARYLVLFFSISSLMIYSLQWVIMIFATLLMIIHCTNVMTA